ARGRGLLSRLRADNLRVRRRREKSAARRARNRPAMGIGNLMAAARTFEPAAHEAGRERTSMSVAVGSRLSAAGGGTFTGIDLAQPLQPASKAQILQAFRDHHVVVFPGQALTREQQYAFARNFGEVEPSGQPGSKRREVAHLITNLDKDGNPVDRSSSPVS